MAKKTKEAVSQSAHAELKNLIEKASSDGKTRWQVFSDFLAVAAIGLANPTSVADGKETWQAREDRYNSITGKYKDKEFFYKATAALILEMQQDCPNYRDVLGETFHALNFHDEWKGQFFSPQYLCDAMAQMIIGDGEGAKQAIKERGFVTVHEPAAGSGAMLLAAISKLIAQGVDVSKQSLFFANDLDERCVHMAYIQLSLAGVPAIVQQKNTLTDEALSPPWYTPVFNLDGWHFRLEMLERLNLLRRLAGEPTEPNPHFAHQQEPSPAPKDTPSETPQKPQEAPLEAPQVSTIDTSSPKPKLGQLTLF